MAPVDLGLKMLGDWLHKLSSVWLVLACRGMVKPRFTEVDARNGESPPELTKSEEDKDFVLGEAFSRR